MIDHIKNALIKGKKNDIVIHIQEALNQGYSASTILNDALVSGMDEIGVLWNKGEIFIPEVLIAARAMNSAMEVLEPILVQDKVEPKGVVAIGTVKGDLHDIGKNLVAMMLKGKGFSVIDLGVNVLPEKFVEAVKVHNAKFVCMSALLTTTMLNIKGVVELFRQENLYDSVILACGGAPLSQSFADEVGCHVYEKDAVACANRFLELSLKM